MANIIQHKRGTNVGASTSLADGEFAINTSNNILYYGNNGTATPIVAGSASTMDFDNLTGRPSYNGSSMTSNTNIPEVKTSVWDAKYDSNSTIPIVNGGTGATTSSNARGNLLGSSVGSSTQPIYWDSSDKEFHVIDYYDGATADLRGAANSIPYQSALNTTSMLPMSDGFMSCTSNVPSFIPYGDYVVEAVYNSQQGITIPTTEGSGWQSDSKINYLKFANGMLIYYGFAHLYYNLNITTSTWNGYVSQYFYCWGTYPVPFVNYPIINISVAFGDSSSYMGDYMLIHHPQDMARGTSYTSFPAYKIWRGSSMTFGHPAFTFSAIGRWK